MTTIEQALISGAVLGLEKAARAAQERQEAASTQEERDRARRWAALWREAAEDVFALARGVNRSNDRPEPEESCPAPSPQAPKDGGGAGGAEERVAAE